MLDRPNPLSYLPRMAVLPIVEVPDPRLRLVSEPVAAIDLELRMLVADMFDTMYAAKGIGLAAIQVGEPRRVLVIDLQEVEPDSDDVAEADRKNVRDPKVFINPQVDEFSPDTNVCHEGCLSIPEQYADIERPASCRARWTDLDGVEHDQRIDGFLATCLQHEMDHLNGVLFVDHISRLKRDMILKKLAKAKRAA